MGTFCVCVCVVRATVGLPDLHWIWILPEHWFPQPTIHWLPSCVSTINIASLPHKLIVIFYPSSAPPWPTLIPTAQAGHFLSLLPVSLHVTLLICVFSFRYHVKQCADFYNVSSGQLAEAVAQTNEYYAGYDIRSTRIVFPNGAIDPWHALGITKDITPDLPAVFIKGNNR